MAKAAGEPQVVMPLRAALKYAALGHRVLPLAPGEKRPLASLVRHGAAQASDDERVIRDWFERVPRANVGIRCDHLLVVDLDSRHDGEVRWRELVNGRAVPLGPVQRTPTGGLHLLFQRPAFDCVGKLASGIDVLVGCRYFVAAPSVRIEGHYWWESPLDKVAVPPLPPWLAECVGRHEPRFAPCEGPELTGKRIERARKYAAAGKRGLVP